MSEIDKQCFKLANKYRIFRLRLLVFPNRGVQIPTSHATLPLHSAEALSNFSLFT
jgi:hypothetical protein